MTNYIVKKSRKGIFLHVEIWKKQWSDKLSTNMIFFISRKNFMFYTKANDWIAKKILDDLNLNKEIEVLENYAK